MHTLDLSSSRSTSTLLWMAVCLALWGPVRPAQAGGIFGAGADAPPKPSAEGAFDETLLLELSVNGQAIPDIVVAERLRDGRLALPAGAWEQARLAPAGLALTLPDGGTGYALEAVAGLAYQLDRASMSLAVSAPAAAFQVSGQRIRQHAAAAAAASPPGFYLDYDLSSAHSEGSGANHGARLEAVAFNRFGSLVVGAVLRAGEGTEKAVRTDTFWRRDLPDKMASIVVGDAIGSGGGWSRPVRFAGIRYARDFGTAPGFITYPMPTIAGSAALPSTVDVLINNRRSASTEVEPGPFELTDIPMISGAGDIQLVVRDLLGRETLVSDSYYVAPKLLARGLYDFSYEAGFLRQRYGSTSNDYGAPFAAGTYRRGLSNVLTAELRAEAEADRRAAGLSVSTVLGRLGVVGLAAAYSSSEGQVGGHYLASFQRTGRGGGINLAWSHFDREYRQFGGTAGEHRPRDQFVASVGARLGSDMSGGVSYTSQSRWDGEDFRLVSLNLHYQFRGGAFLGAHANRELGRDLGWAGGLSLVVPLGRNRSLAASSLSDALGRVNSTVKAIHAPPAGLGWGWTVAASDSPAQQLQAHLTFNGNHGQVTADANTGRHNNGLRVGASGSLGRLHGLTFAARRIDQGAFAVVRVGDFGGQPIGLSNQVVSVTNDQGLALVTGLLPYQLNKIAFNPELLPIEAQISGAISATTVPYARSGAYIEFPVRRSRDAFLVLLQPDGSPVPAGARATLGPGLAEFSVARRGEIYVTGLGADDNHLEVRWPAGHCKLALPRDMTGLSPLTCGGE